MSFHMHLALKAVQAGDTQENRERFVFRNILTACEKMQLCMEWNARFINFFYYFFSIEILCM